MNELIQPSRRLLCACRSVVRWSAWLLLAGCVLFALAWGALHAFIVPRISELRPILEVHASRMVGMPVRIGEISAYRQGLIPSFELRNVAVQDAQGRDALQLNRVVATLSPWSLWNWGFEQLYIDSPVLDVRRTADGKIGVGGLDFSTGPQDGSAAADWLFSQTEVVVRNGVIRWSDDLRAAAPLTLEQFDLVLRNGTWQHGLRINATPPAEMGDRFSVVAQFRQPLLAVHKGRWRDWTGQIYSDFSRADVAQLRRYVDPGFEVTTGRGALRIWLDIEGGQVAGGTADLALSQVRAKLGAQLEPLVLESLTGRLSGKRWGAISGSGAPGNFEVASERLQFVTGDGQRWPGGNASVRYVRAEGRNPAQGSFRGDRLDLAAIRSIANRLPVGVAAHAALQSYLPQGLVASVDASWQGSLDAPEKYTARGRVEGFAAASHAGVAEPAPAALPAPAPHIGRPGLSGATVEFDANQSGGRASVAMRNGAIEFPGVFEEPSVPIDQLNADVRWQVDGSKIAVQVSGLKFANADGAGEAHAVWHTGEPSAAGATTLEQHHAYPGVLDLTGVLQRADATRVHRYLPQIIPQAVRHYVRDALTGGNSSGVRFRVTGDLHQMPFHNPKNGDFHIAVPLRGIDFAYVPPSVQAAASLPWPALQQMSGELIFDRSSMAVRNARGRLAGASDVRVVKLEAQIPDLQHAVVSIKAEMQGALGDAVKLMHSSALAPLGGHALARTMATGTADYKLQLTLPIGALDKSRVQGSVLLAGNGDVRLSPESPLLSKIKGAVQFTESSFSLAGVQARTLGGEVQINGGLRAALPGSPDADLQIRAVGTVTAEGLRNAPELGPVAQLATNAAGSAAYAATFGLRRGVPEFQMTSALQGMALNLPAPLNKAASATLPLRLSKLLVRDPPARTTAAAYPIALHDELQLKIGKLVSVVYERDVSGPEARVVRGGITVVSQEGDSPAIPGDGVSAYVHLDSVDVDAWKSVFARFGSRALPAAPAAPAVPATPAVVLSSIQPYLPRSWALRTALLKLEGRELHNMVAGGSREGSIWRANINADELNGYLEYRQATADGSVGSVYARLSRLTIAPGAATGVESLLDDQPGTIPALDIVVDDFDLRGRKLGRVEVEAFNRGGGALQREWRLDKLNVLMPEAVFTASGNWTVAAGGNTRAGGMLTERAVSADRTRTAASRTLLDFKLDIRDSGALLQRFGMADVVRGGKGNMAGQLGWTGSPLSLDYSTLAGRVNLNVEVGQFLKADPGLAKLLSVLSLQSLPRRLKLDFRDVFSEGFAFDFVRGDIKIARGIANTNNLQMKGVNAAVLMDGQADIARETQDLRVVVVPEINAGTASLVATAINPALGLGTFLAQIFLRGPLTRAATQEFHIDGNWADPKITKVTGSARAGESVAEKNAATQESVDP